jgi:predicted nucleotidyltransferase
MKPSEIFRSSRAIIRHVVESHRSCNPRPFASVSYGEDLGENDLDLLVDALPGSTLQDLGSIQSELEKMLKVPVEVITPADRLRNFAIRCCARLFQFELTAVDTI